jgi:hypothetical protein
MRAPTDARIGKHLSKRFDGGLPPEPDGAISRTVWMGHNSTTR